LYTKGEVLLKAGKPNDAAQEWITLSTHIQSYGIPWLGPWLLSRAAQALFDVEKWEAVQEIYLKATQMTPDPGPIVKAELFRQLAAGFDYRDDLVNADKFYNEVLSTWRQLDDKTMAVSNSLLQLADIDLQRGELDQAEQHLNEAFALATKFAPASYQAALIFADFGVLFEDRGELERAKQQYLKGLVLEQRYFPGSLHLAHTLAALGTLAHQRADFTAAEAYYRRALSIAAKLERETLDVAQILSDLSECVLAQRDFVRAKEYEQHALSIRQKILPGGLATAFSLAHLGKISRITGDFDTAENYYQQALKIATTLVAPERERARLIMGEADVFRDRHDFVMSEQLYREAMGMVAKAAPQSLDFADIVASLADALHHQRKLGVAAELYKQALDLFEAKSTSLTLAAEQRSRYRGWESRYFHEYAAVLVEQGHTDSAFDVLESFRAHTLVEMLAQAHLEANDATSSELLAHEHKLQQRLQEKTEYRIRLVNSASVTTQVAGLDTEIEELLLEYQQIEAQLRTSDPQYASLMRPQPLSLAQIQQLLDDNTLLLEYSLGDERSYVWAVEKDSLAAFELPKRSEINRAAQLVYKVLTSRNVGEASESNPSQGTDYLRPSQKLSRMVLGPVATLLKDKRLLVVSDGALQYIPFGALPDPSRRLTRTPLIVNHEIVNLPSASVLAELRRQHRGRKPPTGMVAVLADPVFDSKDERLTAAGEKLSVPMLPPAKTNNVTRSANDLGLTRNGRLYLNRLLYTRNEADAVMSVTPPGKGLEALDFRASRQMVMSGTLAKYRILHFATHGMLDNKHPELSGLVLSLVDQRGKAQDGFLKMQDIYNLKLGADLVVLSGCQTGLGEEIEGEGLVGLTRGFMYAGASRVVASLWNVSDMATAKLMADFYKAMEHDNMRPAAALRNAQIRMWRTKQWNAPYYWAAFEIQGDWQ
jgi:CHAT domain-containing protein/Tfp pilus assembly protein PilF